MRYPAVSPMESTGDENVRKGRKDGKIMLFRRCSGLGLVVCIYAAAMQSWSWNFDYYYYYYYRRAKQGFFVSGLQGVWQVCDNNFFSVASGPGNTARQGRVIYSFFFTKASIGGGSFVTATSIVPLRAQLLS
ncbi:hypothetical protein F4779DRAFT_67952 [Xylariaceae sp. FL0662B]|nr:hypothetical protein F4779DRAFT_67952 [Xylariaceae sp. FL0662B]